MLNIEKLNGVVETESRGGATSVSILCEARWGRKGVEESEFDCLHIPALTAG
jgi:hypothetical protein